MSDTPHLPSRRALLRGFGTALVLPWLESVAPAATHGWQRALAPPPKAPRRLLFLYVPNGIHMQDWTPSTSGSDFDLPYLLEPLAPYRDQLRVISGLAQDKARAGGDGPGDHARAAASFLTGVRARKTGGQIHLGPSADQLAAATVGQATQFRSLQLGCERGGNAGQCDSGYSCAYSHNISWQNETTPADKEVHPRRLFDQLFRGGSQAEAGAAAAARRQQQRSVLDYVRDEAKRLERDASYADQIKLDEFHSGIREMERRLDFVEREHVAAVADELRPQAIPRDFGAYVRLMMDLLVLALETDRSRIATFMIANEGSNRAYREIDIREGHHELSHHQGDAAKLGKIRAINRFHSEQLAYFLGLLHARHEGEATLLDQVMLLYGSGIGDGNRHNHDKLPVLLLGGGGGSLQPGGQHLRLHGETPLNNLLLSMLDRFGTPVETFGDATGRLQGI